MEHDYQSNKLNGDEHLITGQFGEISKQEYDDCAVCQLMSLSEKENRQPTAAELKQAMKKGRI